MSKKVEWFTGDGVHLAYMTLEEQVPEEGEDSFMWPVFTDLDKPETEEWLLEAVGDVLVLDDNFEPLLWEDEDYLDFMTREFRPGALTAVLV